MSRSKGEVREIEVFVGSGNVWADLGYPDADDMLAKAGLVVEIDRIIRARRITQAQAAELMGIDQPKVSNLLRGRFRGYSMQRLMEFLTRLGRDVEIIISRERPTRRKGRIRVRVG